jgi:hypothetical protein
MCGTWPLLICAPHEPSRERICHLGTRGSRVTALPARALQGIERITLR